MQNKDDIEESFINSVNPYDVAEVHKRANSSYVLHNSTKIKFDPQKSSIIKFNSDNVEEMEMVEETDK